MHNAHAFPPRTSALCSFVCTLCLSAQFCLLDKNGAHDSAENYHNAQAKRRPRSTGITASNYRSDARFELLQILQTLSHALDDTVRFIAALKPFSQLRTQRLLDDGSRDRDANDGT
jgi:hypothetical protein